MLKKTSAYYYAFIIWICFKYITIETHHIKQIKVTILQHAIT